MDSESFSMLKDMFGALQHSGSFGAAVLEIVGKYGNEMSDEQKKQITTAVIKTERAKKISGEKIIWDNDYF